MARICWPFRIAELNKYRGRRISMIFQDPMTSLNPYLRIEEQLIEPLLIHEKIDRAAARRRALDMLAEVGIPDPGHRSKCIPMNFPAECDNV
jgi:oligopeptide transport system ATP-binding protein